MYVLLIFSIVKFVVWNRSFISIRSFHGIFMVPGIALQSIICSCRATLVKPVVKTIASFTIAVILYMRLSQ